MEEHRNNTNIEELFIHFEEKNDLAHEEIKKIVNELAQKIEIAEVQNKPARTIVFSMIGMIVVAFFGAVIAYFIPRR